MLNQIADGGGTTDDGRNIWTVLPGGGELDYKTDWNNWKTDDANKNAILSLMGRLNFALLDYHHPTSSCADRGLHVGESGTDDELEGLINFIRGQDYFDYDGDCNVTETRSWVQGDIYHSWFIANQLNDLEEEHPIIC